MTERAYTLTEFNQLRKIAEWQVRPSTPHRDNSGDVEERIRTLMMANIDPAAAYVEWEVEVTERRARAAAEREDFRKFEAETRKHFTENYIKRINHLSDPPTKPEPERPKFGFWQLASLGVAIAALISLVISYLT